MTLQPGRRASKAGLESRQSNTSTRTTSTATEKTVPALDSELDKDAEISANDRPESSLSAI